MPRKPDGDVAMTSTERVHRYRERQRAARGDTGLTDRQKLNQALREIEALRKAASGAKPAPDEAGKLADALAEIARLRTALAAKAHQQAAQPAPAPSQELDEARAEIKRLQGELKIALGQNTIQHHTIQELKAMLAADKPPKPPKPKLDPESEAAKQIASLKKKYKKLEDEKYRLLAHTKSLVPSEVRRMVNKVLNKYAKEDPVAMAALQAWNALGLNNLGKEKP